MISDPHTDIKSGKKEQREKDDENKYSRGKDFFISQVHDRE
jgi:hypothetical protein